MTRSSWLRIVRVLSVLVVLSCAAAMTGCGYLRSTHVESAVVTLPHVFGDHMVLQRDIPVPVWGRANPREKITVRLGEHTVRTRADSGGKWMVNLPAMDAGGPYTMAVTGRNTIVLDDVLIGEVWICSGQSNMAFALQGRRGGVLDHEHELATADYPAIRLFQVPTITSGRPVADVEAFWQPCRPETVADFSAVAYFFGRTIHKEVNVPVGLIQSAWGGKRIEPFTPPAGFRLVPELKAILDEIEEAESRYKKMVDQAQGVSAGIQHPLDNPSKPTAIYNAMIHPLVPFAVRGAIWYQGEANRHDGMMYFDKMKALIGGWRKVWGQGDFPFYYVQLAPFRYPRDSVYVLPELWEAQTAALSIPNTGMAVTADIGNLDDIHPRNKQDVGKRLALWALAKTYGKRGLVYSGPLYRSMALENGTIRIHFDHTGSGLASRDGNPLRCFQIAGPDGNFIDAEAAIDGHTVVVRNDTVSAPVAVRFGWARGAEPNLSNVEGLPASPFRTDTWETVQ